MYSMLWTNEKNLELIAQSLSKDAANMMPLVPSSTLIIEFNLDS